jgi:hypothetical protein
VPTVASDIRSGSRVASVAMRAEAAEGQGTHYSRRNPAHHPLIHESGVATLLVDRSVAAASIAPVAAILAFWGAISGAESREPGWTEQMSETLRGASE